MLTTSPCRAARTDTVPVTGRVDVGVAEPHRSLIFLRDGILEIGLGGLHRALRSVSLLGARNGGGQVRSAAFHQLLLRLHGRLRGLQIGFRLGTRSWSDWTPALANSIMRRLSLAVRSSAALACRSCALAESSLARALATSLEVEPEVDCSGVLHLRHFVLQARDRSRRAADSWVCNSEWIEHGDQITGLHRRAFIHQQFLNAAFHLRADNHLIRVDRADQHQVFGVVGGEKNNRSRRSQR